MRAIVMIGLMAMVLLGPFMTLVIAADKDRPFGELPPPGRHVEESPFGGPPPKHRSLEPPRYGKKCRTQPKKTCQLAKAELVGGKCTCPGARTAQGTVVE